MLLDLGQPWIPEEIKKQCEAGKPIFHYKESQTTEENEKTSPTKRLYIQSFNHDKESNTAMISLYNLQGMEAHILTNRLDEAQLFRLAKANKKNLSLDIAHNNGEVTVKYAEGRFYGKRNQQGKDQKALPVSSDHLADNESGLTISEFNHDASSLVTHSQASLPFPKVISAIKLPKEIDGTRSVYMTVSKLQKGPDFLFGSGFSKEKVLPVIEAAKAGGGHFYVNRSTLAEDHTFEPMNTIKHIYGIPSENKNVYPPKIFSTTELDDFQGKPAIVARVPIDNKITYIWDKRHELTISGTPLSLLHDKNQKGYFLTVQAAVEGAQAGYENKYFFPERLLEKYTESIKNNISNACRDKILIKLSSNGTLSMQFEQRTKAAKKEIQTTSNDETYTEYRWEREKISDGEVILKKPPYSLSSDEQKNLAARGKVFWDITSDVRALSQQQRQQTTSANQNSYDETGNIIRIIETEEGMFIDQAVGKVQRTLFTNIFQKGHFSKEASQLREAAKSEPNGDKAYHIKWVHEEQNLELQSTKTLLERRQSFCR